jgi:hypothetical protein
MKRGLSYEHRITVETMINNTHYNCGLSVEKRKMIVILKFSESNQAVNIRPNTLKRFTFQMNSRLYRSLDIVTG